MNATETPLCPPHYWEVSCVRIDGVCHYHHRCKKCSEEKDVLSSSTGASRWTSRNSKNKR